MPSLLIGEIRAEFSHLSLITHTYSYLCLQNHTETNYTAAEAVIGNSLLHLNDIWAQLLQPLAALLHPLSHYAEKQKSLNVSGVILPPRVTVGQKGRVTVSIEGRRVDRVQTAWFLNDTPISDTALTGKSQVVLLSLVTRDQIHLVMPKYWSETVLLLFLSLYESAVTTATLPVIQVLLGCVKDKKTNSNKLSVYLFKPMLMKMLQNLRDNLR